MSLLRQFRFSPVRVAFLLSAACCLSARSDCHAQVSNTDPIRLTSELISHAVVDRDGNSLIIHPNEGAESGTVTIPRVFASIRSVHWESDPDLANVSVSPEIDHWILRWKSKPTDAPSIVIEFDRTPFVLSELQPAVPTGDGSVFLEASQAKTFGKKLRYEPQPFKNTVGYWVNPADYATWTLRVDQPGRFNVGILQGCGKGQGGSLASVRALKGEESVAEVEFEVLETGHFQNFQWRNVGQIEISESGTYSLQVAPKRIARNALMDVRAIHLVRLPN